MSKYDFSSLQSLISKYHNGQILRETNKKEVKKTRKRIYDRLLIKKTDTAQLIILKILFFWISNGNLNQLLKTGDTVATIPIDYVIKPGDNIPQLAVIFRVKGKKGGGNYPIHIPHYNGTKTPHILGYRKGSEGCILTLRDNTKIVIHANTYKSAEEFIRKNLLKYVEKKYRTNNYQKINRQVKSEEMEPIRADYYPFGSSGPKKPEWRHYF